MAKRKKKSGGGAFGKAGSKKPGPPQPMRMVNAKGSERTTKLIHRIAAAKDFTTMEEFQRFMNEEIVGKSPEELEAMADELSQETPLDRAERMIEEIPDDATDKHAIRTAKQALAVSEDCMAAWLEWASSEENHAKAMEIVEMGIARGRISLAGLIAEAGPERGLWGYIQARDFMRLLHQRAKLLETGQDIENAISAYREMLALNPNDNQGIRGDLLRLLMVFRRIDEGRALLDAYPGDADTAMAWGNAFVTIVETMDRRGDEQPDEKILEAAESPEACIRKLGPAFENARAAVRQAVKVNPFVPLFYPFGGVMEVETDDMVTFGGPYEAISYLQLWAILWHLSGLPMLFMAAATPKNPQNIVRGDQLAAELADVLEQLKEFDGEPWWEKYDKEER